MKKFKFSLQSVLFYDTFLQNKETQRLNILKAEYQSLDNARQALQASYDREVSEFHVQCAKGLPARKVLAMRLMMEDMKSQIQSLEMRLLQMQEQIDRQREKLIAVTTDKMTVEKLRENKFEAYTEEVRKKEEIIIEEFVANTASRLAH
ncbi:MAG TPA: hypothetical protein GX701_03080 [Clostridiales bacterium]|jgi:flagellar export protein FliJ|nr:hypothetical protein [Clostridiales bacterium]